MINDTYARAGVPIGSEIKLKGYEGQTNVDIDTITGTISHISNYVVTTEEFKLIEKQLRQQQVSFTEGYYKLLPHSIMFFTEPEKLTMISKATRLDGNEPLVVTREFFAIPYINLIENALNGQSKLFSEQVSPDPMYFKLGVSNDGNYSMDSIFVTFQSLSPLALLALLNRKKRPGYARGKQIKNLRGEDL
jgi:hypothetical protein